MHLLSLLGGCCESGSNGPDGLVGHHHPVHDLGGKVENAGLQLTQHLVEMDIGLSVLQAFATAEHHTQSRVEHPVDLLGHRLVVIAMAIAALTVADDHILHATTGEHVCGELPRLGTGPGRRDVLGAQPKRQRLASHGREIRGGRCNHHLDAFRRTRHLGKGVCKFLCLVE